MSEIAATLPWLLPGTAVAFAASLLASNAVGRWLGVRRSVAWVGLFSLGVILASTLSPLDPSSVVTRDVRACDYTRTWLASLPEMVSGSDVTLNIILFLPLGWAIGIAPWSARKVIVVLGAIASPLVIEALQLLLPPLGRGCESADILDNLTGLAIGFLVGMVVALVLPAVRRPIEPGG